MELREFVSASLTEIVLGVREANMLVAKSLQIEKGPFVLQSNQAGTGAGSVDFDVAVTVSSAVSGKVKGEGSAKMGLSIAGAEIRGAVEGGASREHEHVSRIRFSVGQNRSVS